ncbi:hypothetical protein [Stenotrophomonas phage c9-N]|nr:hypothetical protein [Stenotrophomonas phage c9-N]
MSRIEVPVTVPPQGVQRDDLKPGHLYEYSSPANGRHIVLIVIGEQYRKECLSIWLDCGTRSFQPWRPNEGDRFTYIGELAVMPG